MSCGIPESPGNGSFMGNEFTLESKVTYACNEGFKLDASQQATAVCQEDGLWSNRGKPPTCKRKCPVLCLASDLRSNRHMSENSGLHSARSFPSAYEHLSLPCGHVTLVYSVSATVTINISSAVMKVGHVESPWVHQHLDPETCTENPGHAAVFSLERFSQEVIETSSTLHRILKCNSTSLLCVSHLTEFPECQGEA